MKDMTNDRRQFLQTVARGVLGAGVTVGTGLSSVSAWSGQATNSVLNQARPDDGAMLKIVKVEPHILKMSRDAKGNLSGIAFMCCRVETEEGIVGWGEGTNFPLTASIATEINSIKQWVIGQSAWDIERIWNSIYRARNAMKGSTVQSAIACIDIALWDIVSQKLNLPLYKLLGGKVNERLRIYKSFAWEDDLPRNANAYRDRTKQLVKDGSVAGKWSPFFTEPGSPRPGEHMRFDRQATRHSMLEVKEMVRGIREADPDFEICVECSTKFNVGTAVRIAKMLEPYDIMFLEEPVPPEQVDAMIQVQQATSIPIAAGERLKSRLEAREYIERDAFRLFQPDVARAGGITEFRKMVAWADAHYIPVSPHNPNGPISVAAHIHLSTAMPNFTIMEEGTNDAVVNRELFGSWDVTRAYYLPLEKPGLGLKITDQYIRDHTVPPEQS